MISPGSASAPTSSSPITSADWSAGLVRSRRDGKMVMYELTEAGTALLAAVLPAAEVAA